MPADVPEGMKKEAEEGGCGVVGFAGSVMIKGRHIRRPSVQMHNRGNGKGGGIAAAGLDPAFFGVSREVMSECYLLNIALLDPSVQRDLENEFVLPRFEVVHSRGLPARAGWRDLGLLTPPPDVKQYFVRAKKGALDDFRKTLSGVTDREAEDEFVFRNSFAINRKFYASLGEKKAFVLSHARDLLILKIVGYAEDVVRYYGIEDMPAHVWIAHQRYPTKGRVWHPGGAHPFIGMNEALVHNGDFANYASVTEYLRQRNLRPQFLTDTEVSVMLFDLWSRAYRYPLEWVIEGLAPTTELDFDRLPPEKRKLYSAIQATHIHASPDGPWFFIIGRSLPDEKECQLLGITDTAMLRPQVFAFSEGRGVQIGLCASEKQAIDAALESISEEDGRFRPIADKYWNARGGSHTDGGAFVFRVKRNGAGATVGCFNKFGDPVSADPDRVACDFSEKIAPGTADEERGLLQGNAGEIFGFVSSSLASWDYGKVRWAIRHINSIEALTLLNDLRYGTGGKKRSSVLQIIRSRINALLDSVAAPEYRRITFAGRDTLRPPRQGEKTLVIDASGFEPEGALCDARLLVKAYGLGWRRFIVYRLSGQRFHGCGLGPASGGARIDLYGSSGDYAGSGMDGCELHIHNDGQDQLGQILKDGKLVVYGNVGQTFMYGAKGGSVFIMGSAAGRPLINAVGRPRVVINGTCLDFLAESFMAGDALKGGGFVIVNGVEFGEAGGLRDLALPYPGSNLFSLASGGALYIRDPEKTVVASQLNGGRIVKLSKADWDLIRPYLEENEALFHVRLADLLRADGKALPPEKVYRKIMPLQAALMDREIPDEDE